MLWIDKVLKILNENTGVTLIISALGFGFNEWVKTKNAKNMNGLKFKTEHIDVKTLEKENELYLILSDFCLSNDYSEEDCIASYEKAREFLIKNNLFLRKKISDIGNKFTEYIIEEVPNGGKDLQKEEDLLNEFKKGFRN